MGSGGREHCLAWKISQSSLVDEIYCAPGNGGTSTVAKNVNIAAEDIESLLRFALDKDVDLTVVGPEVALVNGIVDRFQEKGLKVFGPNKELACLEGSKVFAKEVMRKYGVPTADFEVFDNPEEAKDYVRDKSFPVVIKADGLAAGKGVIICDSVEEANEAVDLIMVDKKFAEAGDKIVVEDFVRGEEVSVLIFTDGKTILPLVSSQDHKRALDGDEGLNTGGMGAYSPASLLDKQGLDKIIKRVFEPLIKGLEKEGKVYQGILYGGFMIKDNEPYVLEFNVRFGDPEIQAILPKLKSDLVQVMIKTIDRELKDIVLEWDDRVCLCVVLASGGYPGSYEKGKKINGLNELRSLKDILVFHAGTKSVSNGCLNSDVSLSGTDEFQESFITSGGRVLNVVGLGDTIKDTQSKVYRAIEKIHFDDMRYRKDIGSKALRYG